MEDSKINIGYTTQDHLCLDLDNTTIEKGVKLCRLLIENYPYLGRALIVNSSCEKKTLLMMSSSFKHLKNSCKRLGVHIVFDNKIPYSESCKIIETLAHLDVINKEYVRIRHFRNDMTLRVSHQILTTGMKQQPQEIVELENPKTTRNDGYIEKYRNLLKICQSLFFT